ncbi:MAG: aminoglycoside phosphotransferase family protein [Chloroflexi bacterium]|nr:aminoglycoside phosphotransferase family protein [Chloroflexota bacterium]MCY4246127.1 aminoglycoside phosphotransferase family protein [Chloroflexota bacterium]
MLNKPDLPDQCLKNTLIAAYGITPTALEFLPIGNDSRAWSYRVEAETTQYFAKLRRGQLKPAVLYVPHHLRRLGIEAVVAPLATQTGGMSAPVNAEFSLILYPFVAGRSAWGMQLPLAQWRDWGKIVRAIHDAPVGSQLAQMIEREVFGLKWLPGIARVERAMEAGAFKHEAARQVANIWREQADAIALCKARFRALGEQLHKQAPPFVICHADIHTANIIVADAASIHIVDWDETLLAPIERDLMFFLGDGHALQNEAAFLTGYGDRPINHAATAYYRYDWTLQEFADYGERVFCASDLGEEDLALALREFAKLFAPGDVVQRAHEAFARIS